MDFEVIYSVVVPVYNEEAVIKQTYWRLKQVMGALGESYELIFVNDGSRDHSAEMIKMFREQDETVKLISFSRNFGHQTAITAGMDYASGAAVVVIDADLQDPPELIPAMIQKWHEGYEVVYAKRTKRKGETFFKKRTAHLFYRLLHAATDIDIPVDTGDFRLLDHKVCNELKRMPERNRFVRGLVSWVGFRQTAIEYEREERLAGETKYSLKKMVKLSIDGLTSFSFKPLKLANYSGALMILSGVIFSMVMLILKLFFSFAIPGWDLVIDMQLYLTGFLSLMIGIGGEYIARIYDEARERPLYIVSESCGLKQKEQAVKNMAC